MTVAVTIAKTLGSLLAQTEISVWPDSWEKLKEERIYHLRIDSRAVRPGDLFIAIAGFEHDGHDYLAQAARNGAVAAVVEHPVEAAELPQFVVPDGRSAEADLACAFYDNPTRELHLCGITGSNGKTSTSLMYRKINQMSGKNIGLIGTVAYETGEEHQSSVMTTPDSIDLQCLFRQMRRDGLEAAVMEASSIGLSQQRTRGCDFDIACFLNLSREHLDYHGSMEAYFAAKKSLISGLKPNATAVINCDDPWAMRAAAETDADLLTFGLSERAAVRATDIDLSSGFAQFTLTFSAQLAQPHSPAQEHLAALAGKSYSLQLQVPGIHSVMNALAAIAAALAAGHTIDDCIRGIEAYRGVERRFQEIYHQDFRIFDDHFANASNIRMTLESLARMDYKSLHLVYAIRGRRGVTVNRENVEAFLPKLAALRLKTFIATKSEDTVGHYDEVQPEEEAVFREMMNQSDVRYTLCDTLAEAVAMVIPRVKPGDVVLLAGCQGMDAGARLILPMLAADVTEESLKTQILAPLVGRECGWQGHN